MYGEEQDCVTLRTKYLKTALAISEGIDAAIYLFNPQIVTEAGEWEAWFFSNELPGAIRYQSFPEMMQAERTQVLDNLQDTLEFRATCRK